MKKIIYLFLAFIIFFSCQKQDKTKIHTQKIVSKDTVFAHINEYAKFLSAKNTTTFEDIQKKDFYKSYAQTITTNWNSFYINQLSLIKNWIIENNITSKTDTSTVFYPFSGPDFPFVNAFYPYAKNYIFVGLENTGQIPDLSQYSDLQIEQYLYEFLNALSEYFQNGYFSTKNMKKNFRNPDMNGIVHPLTFFITMSGYKVKNIKYFVLDELGKPEFYDSLPILTNKIKGLKITFADNKQTKNLYYLQVDLSNANFYDHPELVAFLSEFGRKNVFLKSASYLLHRSQFSDFRDFLLMQAKKILQDDSGFSYNFLKKNNLKITLYGNYYHTLNIFKEFFQKDLFEAYKKQKPHKLAFRFGYNIPFEETALIYAVKNDSIYEKYPFYTIQFQIKWDKINTDSFPQFLQPVNYFFDEGYYKYYSGHFDDINKAKNFLSEVKKSYPDAFMMKVYKYKKQIING